MITADPRETPICVGICLLDPDSGYCLGCGRPPLPVVTPGQGIVAEEYCSPRFPEYGDDDRASGNG